MGWLGLPIGRFIDIIAAWDRIRALSLSSHHRRFYTRRHSARPMAPSFMGCGGKAHARPMVLSRGRAFLLGWRGMIVITHRRDIWRGLHWLGKAVALFLTVIVILAVAALALWSLQVMSSGAVRWLGLPNYGKSPGHGWMTIGFFLFLTLFMVWICVLARCVRRIGTEGGAGVDHFRWFHGRNIRDSLIVLVGGICILANFAFIQAFWDRGNIFEFFGDTRGKGICLFSLFSLLIVWHYGFSRHFPQMKITRWIRIVSVIILCILLLAILSYPLFLSVIMIVLMGADKL